MATLAGKQTGYADPTMRHETDQLSFTFTGTADFAGEQPKGTDPAQPTMRLEPKKPSDV